MRAAITAGLVVLSAPSAAFVPSTSASHRASTADAYLGARPTTPSAVVADHDAARGTRRRSAVQLFASGLASDGDANVMTIEDEPTFEAFLESSTGDETIGAVMFHATYCQKCKMMMPKFARLANKWESKGGAGKVVLGTVNVNKVGKVPTRQNITKMPTVQLFKGGEQIWEFVPTEATGSFDSELMRGLEDAMSGAPTAAAAAAAVAAAGNGPMPQVQSPPTPTPSPAAAPAAPTSPYGVELATALSIIRRASAAAYSLQADIAKTKKAVQKEDEDGTGFGVSPVTVADFTVQAMVLSALRTAFPNDKFIAEESSKNLLGAGKETVSAVIDAVGKFPPPPGGDKPQEANVGSGKGKAAHVSMGKTTAVQVLNQWADRRMAERKYAQEVAKTAAAAVSVVNTPSPSATATTATATASARSTTVDNRRSPAASAAGLTEKEKAAVSVCEALDLGVSGLVENWSKSGRTWVLDPIDGTKGFLRGDQFALALSLLDRGRPVVAVIGCPNLPTCCSPTQTTGLADKLRVQHLTTESPGMLFWAEKDQGAFSIALAEQDTSKLTRLQVSRPKERTRVVRCESYEAGHSDFDLAAKAASFLEWSADPIRMDGQGKYAIVAAGEAHVLLRLPREGYVENIWDHSGALVVEEAGGKVTDTEGRPLDFSEGMSLNPSVKGVVVTNGALHDEIIAALKEAKYGSWSV